jgi:hypothetical protein
MKLYLGLAKTLLLYVYLPLAIIGLLILLFKLKRLRTRLWAVPFYLLLAYAIPLGDVTWHSWHMARVCSKAGIHIYRSVEVDGFYSNSPISLIIEEYPYAFVEGDEAPGFPGYLRRERINGKIVVMHKVPELLADWEMLNTPYLYPDKLLGVTVNRWVIRNRHTGEVISESMSYSAWRGWIDALISSVIDNSVGGCGKRTNLHDKIPEILIPKGASK